MPPNVCIKCWDRSGRVLVCSKKGCPVAIHETCMTYEPQYYVGKFYCFYCWLKRELERTEQLRRKGMLATNVVSYIGARKGGENEEKQNESVSTMEANLNPGECENGPNDDADEDTIHHSGGTQSVEPVSKKTSDEESGSRAHGIDNAGNGERIQEDGIENSGDCEPTKETADAVGDLEENHGKRGKEEAVLPKVSAIETFEFVSPDTETLLMQPQRITVQRMRFKRSAQRAVRLWTEMNPSLQPSTSAKNTKMNQERTNIIGKKSVQCQESTKKLFIPNVGSEKRRRLNWTAVEEDKLKEGVQKIMNEMNKNISWTKVLDYGKEVFHPTRTPSDLKDKWKNMAGKDAPRK